MNKELITAKRDPVRGRIKNLRRALFIFLLAFPAAVYAGATDVHITEIMYNAVGTGTSHEWAELWNGGSEPVTIVGGRSAIGWRFYDGGNHIFGTTPVQGSLTLLPGDFLILSVASNIFLADHPDFTGNLVEVSLDFKKTSGTLFLRIDTDGTPWGEATYSNAQGANGNGKTLEWNRATNAWSESANVGGSPGSFGATPNVPTPAPEPQPAPEPNPAPPLEEQSQQTANSLQPTADSLQQSYDLTADLKISEFLPNPAGSDMEEWIEIYNPMDRVADLTGWKVDDSEGGSNPYEFPSGSQIQPGAYEIFSRKLTSLQLNNDLDSVRLIRPDGTIKDEVAYGEAPEGQSYAKDGIVWKWTESLTPGAENVFPQPTADSQSPQGGTPFAGQPTAGSVQPTDGSENQEAVAENQESPKKQTKSSNKNQKFTFEGVVTVLPGVFGTQYFYAQNQSRGLQIYMNKKDFPSMEVGTKIRASGVMGAAYGEDRLKLSSKDDIVVWGEGEIAPEELAPEELNDSKIGKLVLVSGEAVDSGKSGFTLASGDSEFEIVWKKGAGDMPDVFPGDEVKIAGIVQKNKKTFKILPRGAEDVETIKKAGNVSLEKRKKEKPGLNPLVYVFAPLFAAGMAMGVKRLGKKRELGAESEKL